MYKDTESAGLKREPATGETHHEAQKAVIAGTNAQVLDTEANKSNASAADVPGALIC